MKYLYTQEIIKYTNGLPFKLYVSRIDDVPPHWHQEMEIIFLVQGELQVNIENNSHHIQQGDLILVNANQVHSCTKVQDNNFVIIIQFDLKRFSEYYPQIEKIHFHCNNQIDKIDHEKYKVLKKSLIDILQIFNQKEPGFIIELDIVVSKIILHLIRKFEIKIIDEERIEKSNEDLNRLQRIIKYIDLHYSEKITLEDVAKTEYLSTYYFSHFFSNKMGVTFQTYLKHLRLKKAYKMLIDSDVRIVDIAYKCGFTNAQVFTSFFKEEYGVTPSQHRKKNDQAIINFDKKLEKDMNFDIDIQEINSVLNTLINNR